MLAPKFSQDANVDTTMSAPVGSKASFPAVLEIVACDSCHRYTTLAVLPSLVVSVVGAGVCGLTCTRARLALYKPAASAWGGAESMLCASLERELGRSISKISLAVTPLLSKVWSSKRPGASGWRDVGGKTRGSGRSLGG